MEQAVRNVGIKLIASECQTDVVLSCGGKKLYAHKVMLSIASPVLHDILLDPVTNQHQGIILIFADFQYDILTLILEYIYNGYVNLPNILIRDFFDICNLLKIKVDFKLDPLKNSANFKNELSMEHIKCYVTNKPGSKLECCDKSNVEKYIKTSNELNEGLELCYDRIINERNRYENSVEEYLRHESKMKQNSVFIKNNQINPTSALQIISTLVARDTPPPHHNPERFHCISNDNPSELIIADENINSSSYISIDQEMYSNNMKSKPNIENSSENIRLTNRSQSFDQTHSDINRNEYISSLNYLKQINDHQYNIEHKTDNNLTSNKVCNKQMPELVPINNYHLNKINSSCNNNVLRVSKLCRYNKVTPSPWTPRLLPIGSDPRATHPKYEIRRKKIHQQADNDSNYKKIIAKQTNTPLQYNDKNNNQSSYVPISLDMSPLKSNRLSYAQNKVQLESSIALDANSDPHIKNIHEHGSTCLSIEPEYIKEKHETINNTFNTHNQLMNNKEKHKLTRKLATTRNIQITDSDTEVKTVKINVESCQEHNIPEIVTITEKQPSEEIYCNNEKNDKAEVNNILHDAEQQKAYNNDNTETISVKERKENIIKNQHSKNKSIDSSEKPDSNKTECTSLTCGSCGDKFINKETLKEHVRRHIGEKPYFCSECGKTFSQLRNYKYHRSVHEGTREFAAECPECGKHFNDRGYLSSHLKIHRNRKEYKCPHCPKRFNQRVAYNMHVRIHTGIKPHQCTVCEKSFSRKMLLRQHMRVHTGERPYSCTVCGKRFADRSNMSLHARLHTGVKPYSCTICNKSFTKKHHLKTHMNYHSGAKPYICPSCGLAFSQSSNMRTHYKKCSIVSNSRPILSDISQKEESNDHDKSKLKEMNR